jgi:hypothetical protein
MGGSALLNREERPKGGRDEGSRPSERMYAAETLPVQAYKLPDPNLYFDSRPTPE